MGHVEFIYIDGHQVTVQQLDDNYVTGDCVCGIFVREESLIKTEERLRDTHLHARLLELKQFIEHEMKRINSCTRDIVEKFEAAIAQHKEENFE